jgi:hypothetical protein
MRCMVVLWSTHSVDSDWVKEEAEEARALGNLIPVLIEPVKPPVGFRSIQAADLTDWDGSTDYVGARQLIADLESLIGKPRLEKFSEAEEAPRKNQPIPEPVAEETPVVERSAIRSETARLAGMRPGQQTGSTSMGSYRKPVVGWKAVTIGAFLVGAVLGSLLWFGGEDAPTSGPEVATSKPAPASAPSLVSLGLSGDRQEIGANETLDISLKGQYSDGTQKNIHDGVKWLSSDLQVATIDSQGRVTGQQLGQTKITARYGDLVSPAWTVVVRPEKPVLPVTVPAEKPVVKTPAATKLVALTVSPPSRELKIQERLSLRAKARYSDGNEKGVFSGIEWRSSDTSIASVDSRGGVGGIATGKNRSRRPVGWNRKLSGRHSRQRIAYQTAPGTAGVQTGR